MRILDKYILKKYLLSFLMTLFILLPIAVVIDVSEKVDKFLRHDDLTFSQIMNDYYLNFLIYYGNTFMPLAIFIACIFFTSKLANNTEVIAINSANISFTRFLKPYFIGATILTILALSMNHFVVPSSSKVRKAFEEKYIKHRNTQKGYVNNFNLQLNDTSKVFIKSFNLAKNNGYNFSYQVFDGTQIKYKLYASNIQWNPKSTNFTLRNFTERRILDKNQDSISKGNVKYIELDFSPTDMEIADSKSLEMTSLDLKEFISKAKKRGVKNLNSYYVELYQRTSLPISTYILTLIAVALASRKKRGGIGMNLALGIGLMFVYVFFMKVAKVLGSGPNANPLLMAWLPNVIFGIIAVYLYIKEKKQG